MNNNQIPITKQTSSLVPSFESDKGSAQNIEELQQESSIEQYLSNGSGVKLVIDIKTDATPDHNIENKDRDILNKINQIQGKITSNIISGINQKQEQNKIQHIDTLDQKVQPSQRQDHFSFNRLLNKISQNEPELQIEEEVGNTITVLMENKLAQENKKIELTKTKKFEKSKILNLKKMVKKVQTVQTMEKETKSLRQSWVLIEENEKLQRKAQRQKEIQKVLGQGIRTNMIQAICQKYQGTSYFELRNKYENLMFTNMTNQKPIQTIYDIVSVLISNNNKWIITLQRQQMIQYHIQIYDLEFDKQHNYVQFNGNNVKAQEINQNKAGNVFAVVYHDHETFQMIIFNKDGQLEKLNLSNIIGISQDQANSTQKLLVPQCMFLENDDIFVNIYLQDDQVNFHFVYQWSKRTIIKKVVKTLIQFKDPSFPMAALKDTINNNIVILFRRGNYLNIKMNHNHTKLAYEQTVVQSQIEMMNDAYEQFFMHKGSVMIAKTYKAIKFYQQDKKTKGKQQKWKLIHKIKQIGQMYKIQKSNWFTITDEQNGVRYYQIDSKTNIPDLKIIVGNIFDCTHAIYSDDIEFNYNITYQKGNQDLLVETRKMLHSNRAVINDMPQYDCLAVECKSIDSFIIVEGSYLVQYDFNNFQVTNKVKVTIPFNTQGQQNRIMNLKLSNCEIYLSVIIGRKLVNTDDYVQIVQIFQKNFLSNKFEFLHFVNIPIQLSDVSAQIEFNVDNVNELFFSDYNKIWRYNYTTQQAQCHFDFVSNLNCQPDFLVFNENQQFVCIATQYDVLWIDLKSEKEIDIDNLFLIGNIKQIYCYEKKFYILANRFKNRMGIYLLEFDEAQPSRKTPVYVIDQILNSEIDCASLKMISHQSKTYIVICFKILKQNNFCIKCINMDNKKALYIYEKFCLEESLIYGLPMSTKDLVLLAEDGISVLRIFENTSKKLIKDTNNKDWMIHSLQSCLHLKIEESNQILIEENENNKRSITIQEQQVVGKQKKLIDLYKIKIKTMTLIDLLLFQSIYVRNCSSEKTKLIEAQPKKKVFYQCFDELSMQNLLTLLCYDSKPVSKLLSESSRKLICKKYPMFYYFKIIDPKGKVFIISAIDIALREKQYSALTLIIDYIIENQNSYIFHYLFKSNLIMLINRNISVQKLLESNIFLYQFEYETWPSVHNDDSEAIQQYNGNIFDMANQYQNVFEKFGAYQEHDEKISGNEEKIYKIKYMLNLVAHVSEAEDSLMKALGETKSIQILSSKVIRDLLEFRWKQSAGKLHYIGLSLHIVYVIVFNIYISYFKQLEKPKEGESVVHRQFLLVFLNVIIGLCLIYPAIYDLTQMYKQGFIEYFKDFWNYVDQMHIWFGYTSVIMQLTYFDVKSMHDTTSGDIILIIITYLMLVKTFFYLRIFSSISYIVTMMKIVFYDLRVFLYFYLVLILMFSIIFGILKIGQFQLSNDPNIAKMKKTAKAFPYQEYQYLPYFFSNIISITRISLGDFDFEASTYLDPNLNVLYWIVWYLITMMTCVVFLNFIIAEVGSSYNAVKNEIEGMILKERALLIKESEDMMSSALKLNIKLFPKYLIIREIEV